MWVHKTCTVTKIIASPLHPYQPEVCTLNSLGDTGESDLNECTRNSIYPTASSTRAVAPRARRFSATLDIFSESDVPKRAGAKRVKGSRSFL